jgi:hypothetical protein
MVPRHGSLGDGLPLSTTSFQESRLEQNAVYIWSDWIVSIIPDLHYPDEGKRKIEFFRFWADGRVAFQVATVEQDQGLDYAHADDMQGAGIGRFVIPEKGKVVIECLAPGNYAWHLKILEGRISEDGDVVIYHQKRRGDKTWEEVNIHGKRVSFEREFEYQPVW